MSQEDRFKKQIDQLGRVLAKLLASAIGAKSAEEITQSIKEADKQLEEDYSFKLNPFLIGDIAEFLLILEINNIPNEQLTTIADIYYEYALKCKNQQEQYPLYEKALYIYREINRKSKTYSMERQEKITAIQNHLNNIK